MLIQSSTFGRISYYSVSALLTLFLAGCGGGGGDGGNDGGNDNNNPPATDSTSGSSENPSDGATNSLQISGTPSATAEIDKDYSFVPTVENPGNKPLTFTLQNNPAWLTIDPATGTITGKPSQTDAGTFNDIVVTVSDGAATAALAPFSIQVASSANAPTITSTPPKTHITHGETFTYTVVGADANAGEVLTFSLENPPEGMTIDPAAGIINWVIPQTVGGPQTVIVRVSDPTGLSTVQKFDVNVVVPQTGWTLVSVDSEETVVEQAPGTKAFDKDPATYWMTQWSDAQPVPPHEIQIDLGASYEISGFHYLPRQDNGLGNIRQFQFFVSENRDDWGTPVAVGAFNPDKKEKNIRLDARVKTKLGRFIRLVALNEATGAPFTSIAELNVQGSAVTNRPPQVNIDVPAEPSKTIRTGELIQFQATGTDAEGSPLKYNWTFGNSGTPRKENEDPGFMSFANPGTFTVKVSATDDQGRSGLDSVLLRVLDPSENLVPREAWKILKVDSEEKIAEDGSAINIFDGNPATIWHTDWFTTAAPQPHEIQIDMGAVYSVSGIRYLPRQDGPAARIAGYEVYVSMDGTNWGTAVATGTFENNANEVKVTFPAAADAQFVRLVSTSGINDSKFASAAELNVIGVPK